MLSNFRYCIISTIREGFIMKLKAKTILIFFVTIFISISAVATVSYFFSSKGLNENVNTSMKTAASLGSGNISDQLSNYLSAVSVAGTENTVYDTDIPIEEKQAFLAHYVEQYGFTSGNLLDEKGVSIIDGTDFSDREYVKKALNGEKNISDITLSKYTNTYGISIAAPIKDPDGNITGVIYFRLDIDFMLAILEDLKISDNCESYILNKDNEYVVHPDIKKILTKTSTSDADLYYGVKEIEGTNGWQLVLVAPETDFDAAIQETNKIFIILDVVGAVFALLFGLAYAGYIVKPIATVENALIKIASGNLDNNIQHSNRKDELGVLINTTASLNGTLSQIIGETNDVLSTIADNNLTVHDMADYPGEFNQISQSVNHIKEILSYLIVEIQNSSSNVKIGSEQLADATQLLSSGAASQSSSIEKLMSDINNVAESINKSSEHGRIINEQLATLEQEIKDSNAQMQELLSVVSEVEDMSSDIQKIVGDIDNISFQTNILALNASVEAARAGDNGRGFAVVAEEVSALAAKSGDASKRTGELIDRCIAGIENVKKCADATSESLDIIVENSVEIASAFNSITDETNDEAEKTNAIKAEIGNITEVVQSNSSSALETAASTEELSHQAISLQQMISKFKV